MLRKVMLHLCSIELGEGKLKYLWQHFFYLVENARNRSSDSGPKLDVKLMSRICHVCTEPLVCDLHIYPIEIESVLLTYERHSSDMLCNRAYFADYFLLLFNDELQKS